MRRVLIAVVILAVLSAAGYVYINRESPVTQVSSSTQNKKPAFKKDDSANTGESTSNGTMIPARMLITKSEEMANSAELEILPTMESASKAKNQVWAGAFQLVWNDFMNELVKGPIKFLKKQPAMVDLLNKQKFTINDIVESAYYKKWGEASPKLKKEIEDGIWEKFNEKSQILDSFDFTPQPFKYFLYVMMKKDLEYEKEFEDLQPGKFEGSKALVKYFGIEDEYGRSRNVKGTVGVLFYNNDKDFAVTLRSKQGDLIHLYKVNTNKTLAEIYKEMKQKIKNNYDRMQSIDKFKAPKIDFNKTQEFNELYDKPIKSYTPPIMEWEIVKAMERIEFKMDEKGAKMVAEAGIMALGKSAAGPDRRQPRYFYFTGPYAIFIEEQGKTPYFAAYIKDPAAIQ